MIYTRGGREVTIIGHTGEQQLSHMVCPDWLVKVRCNKDNGERFHFAFTLRATDGIKEIHSTIKTAPNLNLKDGALTRALKEAE